MMSFDNIQTEFLPVEGPISLRAYIQNSRCTGKSAFMELRQKT